jgi:3-dehydroquinate synthase
MKNLELKFDKSQYQVFIGQDLLDGIGKMLLVHMKPDKVAVITDTNVNRLYGERIKKSLDAAGIQNGILTIPAGEESKSLEQLNLLYEGLLDLEITRSDVVIALGGGVVGDLAGFASATFLRGVRLIQIPTTLLSQIDSSIGGKTGLNLKKGKNLAGVYHHPVLVVMDTDLLKTLPEKEIISGLAEVVKYGAIRDPKLFSLLENVKDNAELLRYPEEMIYRCVKIKAEIVQRDERESGERMLLNFGHTIGHAIENIAGYGRYSHGEAVAIGMAVITKNSERIGLTEKGTANRLNRLLLKLGLPVSADGIGTADIIKAAAFDKKNSGDSINLVLLSKIGESMIRKMKVSDAEKFFAVGDVSEKSGPNEID